MAVSADEIRAVMAAEAGIDAERLAPDATLQGLDINSLDVVSVVFEIEDRFGIAIEPDGISPEWTVAQFIEHVQAIDGQATTGAPPPA